MTFGGLLSMLLSLAFVVCLTAWSYYRVLTAPEPPPHEVEEFHSA